MVAGAGGMGIDVGGGDSFGYEAIDVDFDEVEVWLALGKGVAGQWVDGVVVADAVGKSGVDELLCERRVDFVALWAD